MPKRKAPQTEPVTTGGSATRQAIVDALAYARDDIDDPRSFLTIEALYDAVAPGIWGHAPIAEAQRQGYTNTEPAELMVLGKRPYFERCLTDALRAGEVVLDADVVRLAETTGGYEPGSGKRKFQRANLSTQAGEVIRADGSGLHRLFPPMGARQFEELVLSMQVEGYDPTKPIVRDKGTGQIIDGKERARAAAQAGVTPVFVDLTFSDDLERLRFALRANWLRRGPSPTGDREVLERGIRERHLNTREVARMLGKLVAGEGQGTSVLETDRPQQSRMRNRKPQFRDSARAVWGTVERWMAAARDAREMMNYGLGQKEIGQRLAERYEISTPLKGGTMWSLARNAELWEQKGFTFPPYGEVPPLSSESD